MDVREFALWKWVRISFSGLQCTLITTASLLLTHQQKEGLEEARMNEWYEARPNE